MIISIFNCENYMNLGALRFYFFLTMGALRWRYFFALKIHGAILKMKDLLFPNTVNSQTLNAVKKNKS
jgi:hypothetical protein